MQNLALSDLPTLLLVTSMTNNEGIAFGVFLVLLRSRYWNLEVL